MGKQPEIPDLDLPTSSQRPAASTSTPARAPAPDSGSDLFGGGIERGTGSLPPPTSAGTRGKAISVDFGVPGGGDEWDNGIERGGGYEPSVSARAPVSARGPAERSLDVAYKRPVGPAPSDEPSFLEKLGGRALALVGLAGIVVPAVRFVPGRSAFAVMKLMPHAFDATSLVQSGVIGGACLVASIAVGYLGIRARPRSWAMIGSGFVFLIALLVMVTIALVATDEDPAPPDGARLIPYLLPAALALLGLGISGRGQEPFYDGGVRRALPFACGVAGGLVLFVALALSGH